MTIKLQKIFLFSVILSFLVAVLLVLILNPRSSSAQSDSYSSEEILVKFKEKVKPPEKEQVYSYFGTEIKGRIKELDIEVMKIPNGRVEEFVAKLEKDPRVEFAEPNYVAQALEVTSDPDLALHQWGMYKVKAADQGESAWNYTKSDPSVKVAILDTGIDQTHEDLFSKIVASNNCTDSPTPSDLYGHGTHVAGIAAAITNNEVGVAGLGYNASLMNAKVLGDNGSGYYSWIINCLVWAADNGAKVVNMSLGAPYKSTALENAINYVWRKGTVLMAAAGNSGNSSPTYPAYYKNVIAVAATDSNDTKASWSSFGKWVDVAAPGVNIYSTWKNNGYKSADGTSMATPHVAGLSALIWSTTFGPDNVSVRRQIEGTADKIAGTGRYWIYGRINALKAVSQPGVYSAKGKAR